MDSRLIDPHNHVPEVTPDDVWGDPVALQSNPPGTPTVLPPKRPRAEDSSSPVGKETEGLRIEVKAQRRHTNDPAQQLEVQEIDGTVVRLDPEIPAISRMPRQVTFHERPAENEEMLLLRGEGREWGRSHRQSVRWIIGTGVGVAAIVVISMMLLPLVNKSNAARPGQLSMVLEEQDQIAGADVLNDMLPRQPEAEQVFRKFATASIANEVFLLVRDLETVEPLIRLNFRPPLISKDWVPPEDTIWSVFDIEGTQYGLIEGSLPDFSKFSAYMVLSENQLLLDWKATTGYGSATFDELEKGQGNPSEIRARIIPSGFFTAAFPEQEFQSYQFVAPDNGKAIWCYTRRGDPADLALAKLFQDGEILKSTPEAQKVTLRLERGSEDSLPNQWLIVEMLHKDWITP